MSRRVSTRKIFVLVGCFALLAGSAAVFGASREGFAQSGSTVTFTSAEIGTGGTTPQFVEPGPWQISWGYNCPKSTPVLDIEFQIEINGSPMGSYLALYTGGLTGSGITISGPAGTAGTYSLGIDSVSPCVWKVTVSPQFHLQPGAARDIAVGANGAVWVIGTNANGPGGYGIYQWNGSGWAGIPGAGIRIAVDPNGNPWVINSAHQIYRRVGTAWVLTSGAANDLAIGAGGSVWAVGTNLVGPGGYGIYQWTGSGWAGVRGSAVAIAVDPNGNPWVINSSHQIYSRTGTSWALMPGAATALAIGGDGSVWAVGTNPGFGAGDEIYHWTGSTWGGLGDSAVAIAADPNGNPWVTNSNHQIYFCGPTG